MSKEALDGSYIVGAIFAETTVAFKDQCATSAAHFNFEVVPTASALHLIAYVHAVAIINRVPNAFSSDEVHKQLFTKLETYFSPPELYMNESGDNVGAAEGG